MRITLINPPQFGQTQPSLGLCYLASYLEKANHKVSIIEKPILKVRNNLSNEFATCLRDIFQEIKRTRPDLVGITASSYSYMTALELAKQLKELYGKNPIVMGGPHVTFTAEETLLKHNYIDFVARGEGEYTLLELVEALGQDKSFEKIEGLSYRQEGVVRHNPPRPPIKNVDDIPFPARHLVNLNEYHEDSRIRILSARGCPHNCIFCSIRAMWKQWRPRSIKNVLEELKILVERYDPVKVGFADDTFNLDKKRVFKFCEGLRKSSLKITWSAQLRANNTTRTMLQEMFDAGCRELYFGAESADDFTLKIIRKGITRAQVERAVRTALEIGFQTTSSFVINLPFETVARVRKTIRLARKLKNLGSQVQIHMLEPYPGTEVYENMVKYNLTPRYSGDDLWRIMGQQVLPGKIDVPLLLNNVIPEEELGKLWLEIVSEFYYP